MDIFKSIVQSQLSQSDHDDEAKQAAHQAVHADVQPPTEAEIHDAKASHASVYANPSAASDVELGKAAGVQAFSEFEATGAGAQGGGQQELLQMAIKEATQLFSGGGGANKSTVIQNAIQMAMKLFMGKSGAGGGQAQALMAMFSGLGGGGGKEGGGGGSAAMMEAAMGMFGGGGKKEGEGGSSNPMAMLSKFM